MTSPVPPAAEPAAPPPSERAGARRPGERPATFRPPAPSDGRRYWFGLDGWTSGEDDSGFVLA